MSYEGLMRPNDFMLGYKPFSNVIYDESITPLEMLNKLAYKLNEIVASDSNVKDNVDKLLGVWKEAFMAKAGYIEPIETIYSENALNPTMELTNTTEIFKHKTEKNHYIVKAEDRYKAIHLHMSEKHPVNWKVFKKTDNEWVEFFAVNNTTDLDADIYLATSGNSWEYKVQAQDEKYTVNRNFKLSWSFGTWAYRDITCDKKDVKDLLFSDCTYTANFDKDFTTVVNEVPKIDWVFRYTYIEYEYEDTHVGEDYILHINLDKLKVSHDKYSWESWSQEEQLGGAVNTAGFFNASVNEIKHYNYSKMNVFGCSMILYINNLETDTFTIITEQTPTGTLNIDNLFDDKFGYYTINAESTNYSVIYGLPTDFKGIKYLDEITFTFTGLPDGGYRIIYISASNFYKQIIYDNIQNNTPYTINYKEFNLRNLTLVNHGRFCLEIMYNDWLRVQCGLVYLLIGEE